MERLLLHMFDDGTHDGTAERAYDGTADRTHDGMAEKQIEN